MQFENEVLLEENSRIKKERKVFEKEESTASHRVSHLELVNKALEARVADLKAAFRNLKATTLELRVAGTESYEIVQNMESTVNKKQESIEHLKLKVTELELAIKNMSMANAGQYCDRVNVRDGNDVKECLQYEDKMQDQQSYP